MITIVDYGVGNLGSILNMLRRIGADASISSQKEDIGKADKLILPGVGAFDNGMGRLRSSGLIETLEEMVLNRKTPLLGICLGMQLLTNKSEEGSERGLGWIDAETVRFNHDSTRKDLKVPHMGWNSLSIKLQNPLLDGLSDEAMFYFVHSYYVKCKHTENLLATTCYGNEFASCIIKENIAGVQFHPEKSHRYGMRLLQNFVGGF